MILAVDGVIERKGKILLVERKNEPFAGRLALPGGLVGKETVEKAVVREMKEETGLKVIPEQILGVYSDLNRDPRGRIVSIVFVCSAKGKARPSSDAKKIFWGKIEEIEFEKLALTTPK